MKLSWKQIYEGWRNDLFPPKHLEELIRATQEERLAICLDCPSNSSKGHINSFSHCTDCGCPLKKKTACLSCECPQLKWLKQLEREQEDQLKNKKPNI